MKKNRRILFISFISLFIFSFFSCTLDISEITIKERVLTSEILNYKEYIKSDSSSDSNDETARTIMPPPASSADYALWLVFSKVNVENAEKTYVKVSDGGSVAVGTGMSNYKGTPYSDGKFSIILENSEYLLTLYAVSSINIDYNVQADKDNTLKNAAFLYGNSYVDLRNGSGTAVFTMITKNLPGKSSLNFDVVLDNWGKVPVGNVDMEIKDLLTNEVATTYDDNSTKVTVEPRTTGTNWKKGTAANYGTDSYYFKYTKDMSSGLYNFVITFWNSTNTEKIFSWSDVITILPNRGITTPIYLSNAEPIKPAEPSYFKASYVDNSQNPMFDEYQVYFEWDYSDKFEDYFEMELIDLSTSKTEDARHLYAKTASINGNLTDYWWDLYLSAHSSENIVKTFNPNTKSLYEEGMYVSGGLWGNNGELTLSLSLGKRYLARIRAGNTVGTSPWKYVDLQKVSSPTKNAFDSETINMYKIVYHLNGGRYSKETDITDPYTQKSKYTLTDFIVYGIQDKTPRRGDGVYPVGIDFWDGIHVWDSDGHGTMVTKNVGGSLKVDLSASSASNLSGSGAKDDAILGGLWLTFDTDGDLVYDNTKDDNFGYGSLQKVLETEFHNPSRKDIAAFKYWVDDVSKDTSDEEIIAEINKYHIDGAKYQGFENLELWAKYNVVKDPAEEDTNVHPYDDPKSYDIYTQWIYASQSGESGVHTDASYSLPGGSNPNYTFSKSAGVYVSWRINIPNVSYMSAMAYNELSVSYKNLYRPTEAYGLVTEALGINMKYTWTDKDVLSKSEYENLPAETVAGTANDQTEYSRISYIYGLPKGKTFDAITGVAYKSGSYEAGWAASVASPAQGASHVLAEMDISKLISGQTYKVVFTATYGKYSYQKSIDVKIVD